MDNLLERSSSPTTPAFDSRWPEALQQNGMLDLLPVAAYVCAMDGLIKSYNEEAVRLWGRRPVTGPKGERYNGAYRLYRENGELLPQDETPEALCLIDGVPKKDAEIIIERPDHSCSHARISVSPLRNEKGNRTGVICCLYSSAKTVHISSGVFRENALQENEERRREERYHKMIEEVEDYAIILLDREGVIVNWNKGAEKIKGYKEEEIVGKSFQEFYLEEDRQNGLPIALLNEARRNGKAIHEGWRKRKNGTAFWGSILLTALHDHQNNIIGFSKVTRDLTEKKLAEDKTKEHLAQLEFQNDELEQFVYAASHDLKEPLRKIHLYNNYVAENPANSLDPKSMEYLTRSINATHRMKNLIDDLLTYSRATANVEGYDELDLNVVIDELISLHKDEFHQKRIEIQKKPLPVIRAVPFQVKQLFSNLIDNAVKYRHPDRNPHITIQHELINGSKIKLFNADHAKEYHKISVKDNGIGFDSRYADRIFEIFQRLAHSNGINGSGIGLAICKKIVQNHNGFITANGKPGEGASFHIYFPKDELL
ncbi:MAG TPA: PAS domain S-box protein [Puia sp.]|nr:PAS domain S-box protein [Puia sp.]